MSSVRTTRLNATAQGIQYILPITNYLNVVDNQEKLFLGPYRVARGDLNVTSEEHESCTHDSTSSSVFPHANAAEAQINAELGIFKTHMNYSNSTAHNVFRASQAIQLTKLIFYGPWRCLSGQRKNYDIEINVFEGIFPDDRSLLVMKAKQRVCVSGGEMLEISFPNQLYCKPGTWYTVQFVLNGPDTLRMTSEPKTRNSVFVNGYDGYEPVDFEFLRGSRQMPEMEFWVLSPLERRRAEIQWRENELRLGLQRRFSVCEVIWEIISCNFI